jgi:hypothetical protein
MGCNGSKLDSIGCMGLSRLDDQEAVALCRGRADLLALAARHRDALADSHAALAGSLASVSSSLHLLLLASSAQPRPVTLPAASGKTMDPPTPTPAQNPSSPPHSSSHIDFASSSSSGSDSGSVSSSPPHHLDARRHDQLNHPHPLQYPHYGYPYSYAYAPDPPFGYPPPPGSLQLYYARSRPPPASVAVQHPAPASERVYSYFGSADQTNTRRYAYGGEPAGGRAPAPPPSPPRASSWDFFNVFHGYEVHDNYCYDDNAAGTAAAAAPYTPSRCSREVREEEGIPDLEDDDAVVVKEVSSEWPAPGTRSRRSSLGGVSSGIAGDSQWEDCVVDKGVDAGGGMARQQAPAQPNVAAPVRKSSESADVAGEIKAQFLRAADAVWALAPVLEVERRSYQHRPRRSVYHGELSAVSTPYACSD